MCRSFPGALLVEGRGKQKLPMFVFDAKSKIFRERFIRSPWRSPEERCSPVAESYSEGLRKLKFFGPFTRELVLCGSSGPD